MDDRYTNTLTEKIYGARTKEELNKQIEMFFNELFERKRDDIEEEGLQAAAVLYPDGFGGKICERDGKGTHQNSFVNITRNLDGKETYISEKGTGYFMIYRDDIQKLQNAIQVRILAKENELVLSITSSMPISSEFQLQSLKGILEEAQKMKNSNKFSTVRVGIFTPELYFEHDDINDNMIQGVKNSKGSF